MEDGSALPMDRRHKAGIDWNLYRDDVISLYVKQNKTLEETCDYLEKKHGVRPTYVLLRPETLSTHH